MNPDHRFQEIMTAMANENDISGGLAILVGMLLAALLRGCS